MAPAMTSISASTGSAASSLTTDWSVRDILVPVSPSGTGNTFELIDLLGLVGDSRDRDGKTGANGLCNHLYWYFRLVNAGLCEQCAP